MLKGIVTLLKQLQSLHKENGTPMRKFTPVILLGNLLVIVGLQSFTSSEAPILDYIDQYKAIAISEMHRTGIPASITMAQAIVESGCGTSTLSVESNNHFGIKCKGGWEGKTYYFKDDDYRHGRLVKSCFRGYEDSVESYYDHSDFLVENPRYGVLFTLDKSDYKGWAKGLKKCGYATDRNYAKALIGMIEKYQLHLLDQESNAPQAEIALIEPVQKTEVLTPANNTPNASFKPVTSPPKAFKIPTNYKRGEGTQRASIADKRTFQEEVFQGAEPYLFEIVPNVERKDVRE